MICVGSEPTILHTAGLTHFGAREALVFCAPNAGNTLRLRRDEILSFKEYGTPLRAVEIPYSYRRALPKALAEIEGYATAGTCIAINVGVGHSGVVQALVDATFASLSEFHPNVASSDDQAASAFRYCPLPSDAGTEFDVAPLFNIQNERHKEIFLAMMEQDEPATSRELHLFANATKAPENWIGYENFRRHLYAVRRWLKFVPGYREERGDRFRYQL